MTTQADPWTPHALDLADALLLLEPRGSDTPPEGTPAQQVAHYLGAIRACAEQLAMFLSPEQQQLAEQAYNRVMGEHGQAYGTGPCCPADHGNPFPSPAVIRVAKCQDSKQSQVRQVGAV